MTTLYSIDFDFFSYNGELETSIETSKGPIPGPLVYDWGLSESFTPGLQNILWNIRLDSFTSMGLDLETLTSVSSDDVVTWCHDFESIVNLKDATRLTIADSHLWAYPEVFEAWAHSCGPINVVSFDAHHDLVYRTSPDGGVDCSNWLGASFDKEWVEDAVIVYPDWRGTDEWLSNAAERFPGARCTTWTDWRSTDAHNAAYAVFACRSSAWVPPWCDAEFATLVNCLANATDRQPYCVDCEVHSPAHDACTEREFIREEIEWPT